LGVSSVVFSVFEYLGILQKMTFLFFFVATLALAGAEELYKLPDSLSSFPKTFKFGVSTSSYQVEGGWLEGGKGPSTLDVSFHVPGNAHNNDNGDVANDMFHLYPEDILAMQANGIKNYRFSINWVRILPTGQAPVNEEGVKYYDDLINQLLAHGIEPHVTMYHGETPAALEMYPHDRSLFLNSDFFVEKFTEFADVLYDRFGDRVKSWFTFNEPYCISVYGYSQGPNMDKDPYTVTHNILLAHASAYRRYDSKYRAQQQGQVGIVLNVMHYYPQDPANAGDVEASATGYDYW